MKLPLLEGWKSFEKTTPFRYRWRLNLFDTFRVALACREQYWINYVMICRYFAVVEEVVVIYWWGKLRCGEFVDRSVGFWEDFLSFFGCFDGIVP